MIDFGVAHSDALEPETAAAARIETWNVDKKRAKRETVARKNLSVHGPPRKLKHVKLVGERNCALKSAKKV